MIGKKKILIFAILLICLSAVGFASAADNTADAVGVDDTSTNAISTDENEVILKDENEENLLKVENDDKLAASSAKLSQLRSDILNNPNSVINLTTDYKYVEGGSDSFSVIEINRDLTIDGQGHTVDGYLARSGLFSVADGKNFVVKNLKIEKFQGPTIVGGTYINCKFIWCGVPNSVALRVTAINCHFVNSTTTSSNPGVAMVDSRAINCTFSGGTGTNGGAIYRTYAENCLFENNAALNGGPGENPPVAKGGAAYESTCINCIFKGNKASDEGGAGYGGTYFNCRFINNGAPKGDGLYGGTAVVCTFIEDGGYNTARYDKLTIKADNFTCEYDSNTAFPFKVTADKEYNDINVRVVVDKADSGAYENLFNFSILSGQKWIVNMTSGLYRVRMKCVDYPSDEVTAYINVTKMKCEVIFNNDNITMPYGANNELVITLKDSLNRPVADRPMDIYFNGQLNQIFSDENGQIRFELKDLQPEIYNVKVTNGFNDDYSDVSAYATVNVVSKIPVIIRAPSEVTGRYNDPKYNISATVLDYFNNPLDNAPLTVELNGTKKDYVTDEKGIVIVPTLGLTPGNYTAVFTFKENEKYISASAQTKVIVAKDDVIISGGMTRDYTPEDSENNYMAITLTATPYGEEPKALSDAEVSVAVNGIDETYITDDNGVIYVSTNGFSAGRYIANVTYKGNDFFNAKSYLAGIIINKIASHISAENMDTIYSHDTYLNITLTDDNGNPIKGSNVVTVDKSSKYVTDENGVAKISTKNRVVGLHVLNLVFDGNENYLGSRGSASLNVSKDTSKLSSDNLIITYGSKGELIVNLTNSEGTPVRGQYLTVDFNGVETYFADDKGQIRIPVEGLAIGNHTANITFKGSEGLEKSYLTANITVIRATPQLIFDEDTSHALYGYEDHFNVTLKDGNYNPIRGHSSFTVDLNNVEKNYTTDENGKLSIPVIGLSVGEYWATVTFNGNENFTNVTNKHRIIVSREPTVLSSDNLITTYNKEGYLIVTLKDSFGEILAGFNLTVDFNGKKDYVTDENGQIAIPVSGLAAGDYSANITFSGNDNYEGCSLIANITVNKAEPFVMFDTSLIRTIYGFEYTFNATLKDNKYAPIKGKNVLIANFDGINNVIIKNYTTDENGVAVISTADLPVDYYWLAMTFSGNENFTEKTNYMRVIVYKQPTELVSDNITTTHNSGENLKVTLLNALGDPLSGAPVTVNFYGVKTYVTDENGTIEVPTDGLDPSDYLVFISYEGTQNYNQTSLIATISIIKDNTTMDVNWTIVDNDVDITVDVNPNATGLVKFEISGPEDYIVYSEIVNGKAVSHNVLAVGEYSVVTTYDGDVYFNSNSTRGTFTVKGHIKKDTPITADVDVDEETVIIIAHVDSNATGNATFDIFGQKFLVPIKDGNAVFTYDFAPGTYSSEITYLGDNDFNSNSTTVSFTVTEQAGDLKNTTITVDVTSVENDVTITSSINPLASGLMEFNINGKVVYIAVTSGKAVYNTFLPAGDYNVAVTYLGDSRFNANRTSKAFTVTDHIKKNTTMTSDVVVDGYDVTVTVNLDENATGFVEFTLNSNTIYAKVNGGKAVFNALLPVGNYTLKAAYLGDEDFNVNVTDISISVDEIPLKNTPVEVAVEIFENNVTITASVDPAATGLVKFEVTGAEDYTLYAEIKDGKAVLEDVLTAGDYIVVATYLGDLEFYSNSTIETFTVVGHVKKDTSIAAIAVVDNYFVTITASVDSAATGYVTLGILDQTFLVPVDNGKAVFTYDFYPGTYTANVVYLGDADFNNATATASFTVVEKTVDLKNTTIDVSVNTHENDVTITAAVDRAASGLVEFNIDGSAVYIAVTNGKAVYSTDLAAGDYNVVVTYLGDSRFNANRTSKSFSVTDHIKKNTTMTSDVVIDGYDVTVTVNLDANATGFVEFTLNSNSIYAKVNDGKAIFNALLPVGNYTLKAAYLGDEDFNVNVTDISISVDEIPLNDTPITAEVLVNENNVTITANVDSAASGLVKFEVTGPEDYTLYAEVIDGKAVLEDILIVGDYTVVATYLGDFNFYSNSTTETFTVVGHIKKDTSISAVSSVDGDTVTIVTTVDNNATGHVTLAVLGQTFIVPVNGGEAVFIYDFTPGTYSTLVTYLGDDDFNNATTSTSFTVIKQVVELKNTTISVDINSVENNVTIVAGVDSAASGLVEFNIEGKAVYVAVNNGKAVYEVILPGGDYTVIATYMGDTKYNQNKTTKTFTVTDHIKKNTTITSDVVIDGYDVTVTVNIDKNATGFVKFTLNGKDIFAKVADGEAIMNMMLPAGNYTVTATYLGDDDFNANATEIEINVVDIPLNNTPVDVSVEILENNVTMAASVDPAATGLVKFEISGAENYTLYAEIKNGKAILEDILTTGDYSVIVTYLGDSKFYSNSTTETFTVVGHVKKDTSISAVSSVDENTVTIVTTVDNNATGYVTLAVLGQTFIVPINNGKAVFSYDFTPGTYSATVNYLGDDNFNNASTTTSFIVIKQVVELKNTTISVDVDSVENNITIVATVDSAASGLVEFNIEGKAVYVAVNNGKAVYEVILPGGDYTVIATYMGDTKYNQNKTTKAFTVIGHIKKDTSISAVSSVDENTVTIVTTVDNNATGYVTLTVLGQTFIVPVNNGKAVFSYDFTPGTYSATVNYLGDDNFNNASTTTTFTIINQVVELKNTTISVDVDSVENNITIVATVDSAASGLVEFNIEGKAVYVAVNNGKAVYEVILPGGDYTVIATYMGDTKYNQNKTTKTFTVTDHIKKNTTITSNAVVDGYDVTVTVNIDKNATGFVKFTINGNNIFTEVADGKAVMNTLIPPGNYTVTATYLGDNDFNTNTTDIEISVSEIQLNDTPIDANVETVENNVTITASVDPAATGLVKFEISGAENYTLYAEIKNGKAILEDVLTAGDYSVLITYLGDYKFNSNSTTKTFTVIGHVKKDTAITAIPSVDKYTVTIETTVDSAATGYVTIAVLGQTFIVPVNNGKAVFSYDFTPGTYSAAVTYLGDDNFNNATKTTSFTVIKQVVELKNTTISVNVDSIENNVTIVAKVDSSASGLIEFNIDGEAVYVAVNNGKAVYEVILPGGDYTVIATYMGDTKFNQNKTSKTFTVTDHIKKNTSVTSDVVVDGYDVTVTVNIDKNATGFVKFTLKGKDIFAEVADGKAVMNTMLPAGNYTVTATYLGDNDFNANATDIEISVSEIPLKDTPIDANVETVENNVIITASVDPAATGLVKFEISGAENYTIYAEIKNGKAILEDILTTGDYSVLITYLGDFNFNSNSTTETFTVVGHVKKDTAITAIPSVDKYTVTIETTVDSAATGYVTIAVLGQTFIVPVNNGKAVFSYDFTPGTYRATVTYIGDDNFNSNVTSAEFTISDKQKEDANVTIDIPSDVKAGEDAKVTVSIPGAAGNVSVIVDGVENVVPLDENGTASYTIPAVGVGDHSVVVVYPGDETHNAAYATQTFSLESYYSNFANMTITDDLNIAANLVNSLGDPIANATIKYSVGNVNGTIVTDENGLFTIAGKKGEVVTIEYEGTDVILPTSISITLKDITPVRAATMFNITDGTSIPTYAVDFGAGERGKTVAFKLTDANGNPIANATVNFAYKTTYFDRTTDENGIVSIGISTQIAGEYLCALSYLGDETHNATFVPFNFNIQKKAITISASAKTFKSKAKTKKYTVTLKTKAFNSKDGKVYLKAGKKVTLKINGKTYTAKTNAKGQATFYLKITKKGKFTTSIKFDGDVTYKKASKSVKLTIK